jgi:hypothetical protein
MRAEFCWGDLKERVYLEGLGGVRRVVLKRIVNKLF